MALQDFLVTSRVVLAYTLFLQLLLCFKSFINYLILILEAFFC